LHGARAPTGPELRQIRGFTITQKRVTVGRISFDEESGSRKDLYLTTQKIHVRQTLITPGGILNHNPCKRETAEPRLRPRGHWYRQ